MKKVLSIVLSLAMVVCMMPLTAFAASANSNAEYSDIVGEKCEGAVNVLSALGVVNGYEDGTYKPANIVTRAEMAKLIITALGMDSYATATTSSYTDMTNAKWAVPVVEYATNLGIINGYGNGKFGPNDTVTYEQAATMIVRALGYTTDCNEMNGTYPAVYIQKATALGIFDDVEGNQYGTGANRGDIAIMLYNAIDLPEVYADKDGATNYKSGSEQFTDVNGGTFNGVSMLSTLNKNGEYGYGILGSQDADDAIINVREYVGAAGKIYTNKDGDVISVGDLKSVFISGTVNADGDELTADNGTVYKINDDAFSALNSKTGASVKTDDKGKINTVPKFVNGTENGKVTATENGALDQIEQNVGITVSAKVSGKTITNIYAVSTWSKGVTTAEQKLFEESDASDIADDQELCDFDFKTDDNGDIDYTTFMLVGVDSLTNIKEDNVVYVYADQNKIIRKVEVGTEVVEGTLEAFTQGTAKKEGNNGTQATFKIAGKNYKGTKTAVESDDLKTPSAWTLSSESDPVEIGDSVKVYLDSTGKIFQIEQTSASSQDYALVLDYEFYAGSTTYKPEAKEQNEEKVVPEGTKVEDQSGLNGNKSVLKVMTAKGEAITLTMKDDSEIKDGALATGAIITYDLNSSNKVKSVTVKEEAIATPVAVKNNDVTSKGYYNGKAIADSAVIFKVKVKDSPMVTGKIDEDDVDVISLSSLKNTDDVNLYASVLKNGKYDAMVVDDEASGSDLYYGVVTGVTSVDNDSTDADYEVTVLVNGESKNYYVDDDAAEPKKNHFYGFKLNASGYISDLYEADEDGIFNKEDHATLIGQIDVTADSSISLKNKVVNNSVTLDADVIYYKWSSSDETYKLGKQSDMTGAATGKTVFFFDTDKDDDKDGVADLVVIVPTNADFIG